jgi:hypothetical protein
VEVLLGCKDKLEDRCNEGLAQLLVGGRCGGLLGCIVPKYIRRPLQLGSESNTWVDEVIQYKHDQLNGLIQEEVQ